MAACSPDAAVRPTSATLTPGVDTLPVGARVRLVLTALGDGSEPADRYVAEWTTSAPSVLAVTADTADDGVAGSTAAIRTEVRDAWAPRVTIVARAPGSAIVHATVGQLEARAAIVVVPAADAPLRLSPESTTLAVGDEQGFAARARGATRSLDGAAVLWSSSDTTVATIGAGGRVRAIGAGVVTVTAIANDEVAVATVRVRPALAGANAPAVLDFATYDGSREVAHPDVVFFPDGWRGRRYWTALTPYPAGNPLVENPSLFAGDDGEGFVVPPGVTNPLARTDRGHLSDPDLLYDPLLGELRLYYREALYERSGNRIVIGSGTHLYDEIRVTTSGDGVHWSPPAMVLAARRGYFVSPTVVAGGPDRTWRMWGVEASDGCTSKEPAIVRRESADGVRWGKPQSVAFTQRGYVPWHLDVQWIPSRREYWALVAAYPVTATCSHTDLFFATSPDGRDWTTYSAPLVARGALPQFADLVYRSTLAYDAPTNAVTLWLSGARAEGGDGTDSLPRMRWSAAVARTTPEAMLERVRRYGSSVTAPAASPLADRRRIDAGMP